VIVSSRLPQLRTVFQENRQVEEGEKRSLRRSVEKRCERDFFLLLSSNDFVVLSEMHGMPSNRARTYTKEKHIYIWPVWFVHSKSGPAEAEAELAPPLLALVSFHEGLGRCQVAGLHGQFVAGAVDETALGA
jgi:hypothetical protein